MATSLHSSKIAVFTAIIGGYDQLLEPPACADCDFICFTDDAQLKSERYTIIPITARLEPIAESRRYKLLPHQFLPDYEFSLWIDGAVEITEPALAESVRSLLSTHDIALCTHPDNDSVYAECERCIQLQKDDTSILTSQIKHYRNEGLPATTGLYAGGIIARRHHAPEIRQFNEAWWGEYNQFSKRDQLSLNYLLWKLQLPVETIDHMRWEPPFFKTRLGFVHPHCKS